MTLKTYLKKNFLVVNGQKHQISNLDYDISLLDWIRTRLNLKGTKEGCNEGDCGACAVLTLEKSNKTPKAINSCLVRLGQMIGKNIYTIEGIGNTKKMNPIQKSFVKNNASQCGFCTPGFIISSSTLFYSVKKIDDETIHDTLSGNLCRCTGYSPIVKAIKQVKKTKLQSPKFVDEDKSEKIEIGKTSYFHPRNLKSLSLILKKIKNFKFLSGGTDINLERAVYTPDKNNYICLDNVSELKNFKKTNNKVVLGASISLEDLIDIIKDKFPEIIHILKRFGSPLIRNQATIAGNICTSSPIGDLAPILLVLETKIIAFASNGERLIKIKNFFTGYRKNILKKNEIIRSFEIPFIKKNYKLFCWKFSKRYDQDISTMSLAILIKLENNVISDIKISAGGVAEKPLILEKFSNLMIGKDLGRGIDIAINNVENIISPISDLRGSSEYRIQSFKGALKKLEKSLTGGVQPSSIMEVI
tara:strand:- start:4008 stop:5426 length:1419 start_codon:yes stop_codon:yes gene_type:complete